MSQNHPGGPLAARPLHFFWIADCSGSMATRGKIQALNHAIREAIPHMQQVADQNPNAQVMVRAVAFSDSARWHILTPTEVEKLTWTDLRSTGVTAMGEALSLVADQLRMPPMDSRALPPVLVLISDGQPTDDFNGGLRRLLSEPWGKKAVRIAIAIGDDADMDVLAKFIDNPEIPPLKADNAENLVKYIKWASTAVLQAASSPASQSTTATQTAQGSGGNVQIPAPPPPNAAPASAASVW
jgi:uncharacterized protein YegL